jgi:hypothetical protein
MMTVAVGVTVAVMHMTATRTGGSSMQGTGHMVMQACVVEAASSRVADLRLQWWSIRSLL